MLLLSLSCSVGDTSFWSPPRGFSNLSKPIRTLLKPSTTFPKLLGISRTTSNQLRRFFDFFNSASFSLKLPVSHFVWLYWSYRNVPHSFRSFPNHCFPFFSILLHYKPPISVFSHYNRKSLVPAVSLHVVQSLVHPSPTPNASPLFRIVSG